MKPSLLLLLFFLANATVTLDAQGPRNPKHYFRMYKKGKDSKNLTLPGPLVWLGRIVATPFVKDPNARLALKAGGMIGTMKILALEEPSQIAALDLRILARNMSEKDRFEEWITVETPDAMVRMYAQSNEDVSKIKRLTFLIDGDGTVVMLHMKTRIKVEKLAKIIQEIVQEYPEETPKEARRRRKFEKRAEKRQEKQKKNIPVIPIV